ncbi:Uncharacterised protein [Bordetella pertussis]|nr:Uncharacterised protein [Bordetella pertussis]CFO74425.1 Uncharacterised protein [Bordetella pertussis]CFU83799.1 Uncharacterised protein [Bordetella pertussis]CPI14604.1 Uncharacterised protein [Bordetella pertussis]CPK63832.1 Uncharacterised protein [Bordetella pertussis]
MITPCSVLRSMPLLPDSSFSLGATFLTLARPKNFRMLI